VSFRDPTFFGIELKPFEPSTASVTLSGIDGEIMEVENVDRLGFRPEQLLGRKQALCGVDLSSGTVTEKVFNSRSHDSILTLMRVSQDGPVMCLQFEIIDHRYDTVFVTDNDGIIVDCSNYSVRQLTGYSREQLRGCSINSLVPSLFPVFPVGASFSCRAVHRQGHLIRVTLTLCETASGQYCCQMRRLSACLGPETACPTHAGDINIPDIHLGATLGNGAFGVVRLGLWKGADRPLVAVKIVAKENFASAMREAEITMLFRHSHIAQLHKVVETPNCTAIVMEFCAGIDMSSYIVSRPVLMTIEEARQYFWQLASAVARMHDAGIVHRDISLHNIIVTAKGQTSLQWRDNYIKLIDFGLSSQFKPGVLLDTFCGSPAFLSPEVSSFLPYHGPSADVWAMGVVLFCSIMGQFPFSSAIEICSASLDCSKIADTLCADLLNKILTKNASERAVIAQILTHPWLREHSQTLDFRFVESIIVQGDKFETPSKRSRIDNFQASLSSEDSNIHQTTQ
jgi:hypothetical protein